MYYLSVLSIVKDESDYIEEFVKFYLLNGVDHFFLYDNGSKIPLKETLSNYADKCTIIEIDGIGKQIIAYNHFLKNFSNLTEWICIFDADEYAYAKKHNTLKEFVQDVGRNSDCIGINWVIFGNGNHKNKVHGSIIENYIYSEGKQHKNVKCIARSKSIRKFDHPHYPKLKWFKKYVNALGNKMRGAENNEETTHIIQLNHYYTKSLEEFTDKIYKKRMADSGKVRGDNPKYLDWMLTEPERCSVYKDDGLFNKFSNKKNILLEEEKNILKY